METLRQRVCMFIIYLCLYLSHTFQNRDLFNSLLCSVHLLLSLLTLRVTHFKHLDIFLKRAKVSVLLNSVT